MNKARTGGAVVLWVFLVSGCGAKVWTVHEWGTFTSLQDEAGNAIGGINTDDEPVPGFVHRLASFLLLRPTQAPSFLFQGAPSCHPDVTMRLETPVLYFHPPQSGETLSNVNVTVQFRGGWLSEYYPAAEPQAPGLSGRGTFQFGHLSRDTVSQLQWEQLDIGGNWPITNTTSHVWISPRAVEAAQVRGTNEESEKFLFYRGVAHIDAPLRISRTGQQLFIRSQLDNLPGNTPLTIQSLWLVDIQSDGRLAFRTLPSLKLDHDSNTILTQTPAAFASGDYSPNNLQKLKSSLQQALAAEGLYHDEAQALLNTWELSYFNSAGLRVFFVVPRAWVDYYLPLHVSIPVDLNRVMVGRIELVTPEERAELQALSAFRSQQIKQDAAQLWTNFYDKITYHFSTNRPPSQLMQQVNLELAEVDAGQKALNSFITVPKTYATYLDLGRFRNALILEQAERRPTEGLTNFIAAYRLEAYQPPETPPHQ
jgi:hypothetical protein